jgi:hypothetical protein
MLENPGSAGSSGFGTYIERKIIKGVDLAYLQQCKLNPSESRTPGIGPGGSVNPWNCVTGFSARHDKQQLKCLYSG